jgi:hypothetical protein
MFRRLVVCFACLWMDNQGWGRQKMSARHFEFHLHAQNSRRGLSLVTSVPKAWKKPRRATDCLSPFASQADRRRLLDSR